MAIVIFFLIGVGLLLGLPVGAVALTWADAGSLKFFINMITHMFAHANWAHLLGNYIFVFPYALYVESRIGWKNFCKWWLFAGFAALTADTAVMLAGQTQSGIVGSSGACFGIVAAALWLVDENKWAKLACRALLAYFFCDQLSDAYAAFAAPSWFFGGVAYAAHFGGICAGIYLAQRHGKASSQSPASQGALKQ